jgi:hypothetical protein
MIARRTLPLLVFALAAAAVPAAESGRVSIKAEKGQVEFRVGDDLFTRYHIGPEVAKPYLWPVNAANGVAVTRAWPMVKEGAVSTDHVHQKSAWFCHGDVIPEGVTLTEKVRGVDGVDFWAESKGHGIIACVDVAKPEGSKLQTRNEWRTAGGKTILTEKRGWALYDLGGPRLIVMTTDLTPAAGPVVFGDTKEGAFGVRVSDQLRVGERDKKNPKSRITNAAGKQSEKACWGYPSDWCDYSGEIDGKPVGIAVFDDSRNPVRACWHVRDYGLLAANPFGRDKSGFPAMKGRTDLVRLAPGEHLKLRYGILVHDGDVTSGKVAEGYEQFLKLKD